ncbi:ribonuclease Z [Trifolium repens]|nr:ribonuclease Z [Trifolium repens]
MFSITDNILSPEVAFSGDTTSDFMLDPLNADALRAKVLITEAIFLDDSTSIEHARQHGHTHISEKSTSHVNSLEESPWFSEADTLCASVSENYIRNKSIHKDEAHQHPNIFPSTTLTSIPFFFKYILSPHHTCPKHILQALL